MLRLHEEKLGGIADFMKGGNDARREQYVSAKKFLTPKSSSLRKRTAEVSSASKTFEIDRDRGFLVLPPGTFEEAGPICETARELAQVFEPEAAVSKKNQLKQGLLDMESLTLDSPHLQFALRTDVLSAISSYLGAVPILSDIDVWYSLHKEKTFSNSQLYHCDTLDTTQIKVFLYATDVDESSGPLTVMGADTSKKLRNSLNYKYAGKQKRVSDEQAMKLVGSEDEHPIVGPAETCAFVDTSRCFHYGSRVQTPGAVRVVTIFQYFTPTSFVFPLDHRKRAPFTHLDSPQLNELQRLALGMS